MGGIVVGLDGTNSLVEDDLIYTRKIYIQNIKDSFEL